MGKNKITKFLINRPRLDYLFDMYKISKGDFIDLLNKKVEKNKISEEELDLIVKGDKLVGINFLKKVNKIFNKGLTWVISEKPAPQRESSIFFRKSKFNSDLTFTSKKIISDYEEKKMDIKMLSGYTDFNLTRKIKEYSISYDPKLAADEITEEFRIIERKLIANKKIKKEKDGRGYLNNLIRIIENFNIFVFELLEYNKKDKVNFDGFFMLPNIIVIKRQQKYFRREIFTLLHEFAHYLLSLEEVDDDNEEGMLNRKNKIENWCNSFAFEYLLGSYSNEFNEINFASKENNYCKEAVDNIYYKTNLSISALYTKLLIDNKISLKDYNIVLDNINKIIKEEEARIKFEMEVKKNSGIDIKFGVSRPIESNIFKELVKTNYFEGNISEYELRGFLGIKIDKNIADVIY